MADDLLLRNSLWPLFQPRHIAIIGASRSVGKPGHAVVRNLLRCGFPGRISPINPAGGEIEGLSCARAIAEVAEPIDCAMVVVPAAGAVAAVRDCAARRVRAVIVGASGFAESNTDAGRGWQAELTAIARQAGMRLLGPNTNGLYNATDRVSIGYNAAHADMRDPGTVSVISHSGALFGGVLNSLRGLGSGLGKFVPVGNEADIDMLDILDFLIEDDDTTVIGLIIEAISDGGRLRAAARRAAAVGKPIVALKVGRSSVGAAAALAHSSRLAGSARAYDALFRAAGIAGVRSVEALAGGCAVLASRGPAGPMDRRLIAVTTSGAGGALLADAATERGLPLAGGITGAWEGGAGARIAAMPSRGWLRNPIDMGSLTGWEQLNDIYALLEDEGFAGPTVVYAHVAPSPDMDQALVAALAARKRRIANPIVVVAPGGLTEDIEARYRASGIPLFRDSGTCLDSLQCHYQASSGEPPPPPTPMPIPVPEISALLDRAVDAGSPFLSEVDSTAILRLAGLPMVTGHLMSGPDDLRFVPYPVVLKALVPGVAHKHDAGLVQLGIGSADALRDAYGTMRAKVAALGASETAHLLVQPMLSGKAELILGVTREAGLGHYLVIGIGGVHAELLDQVTLFPMPTVPAAIHETLRALPLGRLLRKLDAGRDLLAAVVDAAAALQTLVLAEAGRIDSVDVNPLLVTEDGCRAVDALIVLRRAAPLVVGI